MHKIKLGHYPTFYPDYGYEWDSEEALAIIKAAIEEALQPYAEALQHERESRAAHAGEREKVADS